MFLLSVPPFWNIHSLLVYTVRGYTLTTHTKVWLLKSNLQFIIFLSSPARLFHLLLSTHPSSILLQAAAPCPPSFISICPPTRTLLPFTIQFFPYPSSLSLPPLVLLLSRCPPPIFQTPLLLSFSSASCSLESIWASLTSWPPEAPLIAPRDPLPQPNHLDHFLSTCVCHIEL